MPSGKPANLDGARVWQLLAQGVAVRAVAERMGVSKAVIYKYAGNRGDSIGVNRLSLLTFSGLRGDTGRTWFRMSDLIEASAQAGCRFSAYEVRLAIASLQRPTVKRHGHWHYTEEHRDAVVEAARRAAPCD